MNHYRIAIVVISVLLLCSICFFAYRVWRDRYKNPSYLGTNDLDGQQTNTNPNNMCHMFCFYLLKAFLRCKTTKLKMISQSEEVRVTNINAFFKYLSWLNCQYNASILIY